MSTESCTSTTKVRYEEYYLQGADLFFLVRRGPGVHFAVHSYFFIRDSNYWKRELLRLDYPGAPGTNELTPIMIDVDPEDFASLLWIWYNPLHSIYEADRSTWAGILGLATKWDCPEIRDFVIWNLELAGIPAVEIIKVLRECHVPLIHQFPSFVEIISNETFPELDTITFDDDTIFKLHEAHAKILAALTPTEELRSPSDSVCERISFDERLEIIREVFLAPPDQGNLNGPPKASTTESEVSVSVPVSPPPGGRVHSNDAFANDWEILQIDERDRVTGLNERYLRLPVTRHDFILPYFLIVSFMCALIA